MHYKYAKCNNTTLSGNSYATVQTLDRLYIMKRILYILAIIV